MKQNSVIMNGYLYITNICAFKYEYLTCKAIKVEVHTIRAQIGNVGVAAESTGQLQELKDTK